MSRSGGYERIVTLVRTAKAALRRGETLTGLGVTGLAAGLSVVALLAADNLFRLPAVLRIVLLLGVAALVGILFVRRVVRPASRPITDDAVAVRLEEAGAVSDNGLINALQLGREGPKSGLSGSFTRAVVNRGAATAARVSPGRVVDQKKVARSLVIGGAALGLIVLYALLLPRYFENALKRYTQPTAFVPPVSATSLSVSPGDVSLLRGESLTITAIARGRLPGKARILVDTGDGNKPSEMLFDGQAFAFEFGSVDEEFTYRVEAGDASSEVFRVGVTDLPGVRGLTLTYHYPEYLGKEPKVEKEASGEVRAPIGTRVEVRADLNVAVTDAALSFDKGMPRSMARAGETAVVGEFTVERSGTWSLVLRTRDGLGNRDPVKHRITAIPDEPPHVAITAPAADVSVTLPHTVSVTVRARDDHGLAEITLLAQRSTGSAAKVLRTWKPDAEQERVVSHRIELSPGDLLPGEALTVVAEARDHYPKKDHVGRSRPLRIRVVTKKDQADDAEAALADLAQKLRELLAKERGIEGDTVSVRQALSTGKLPLSGLATRATSLAEGQGALGAEMNKVARAVPAQAPVLRAIRGALHELAANESAHAVRNLRDSRTRSRVNDAVVDLKSAETEERMIIARLEELLGRVDAMLKKLEEDPEAFLDESMDEADPKKALEDALAKLKKFIREQEDVLEQTRKLEEKDVDDFTDEDLALLEKLAAQESDLARFLEDLKDDLSKVPSQDLANSTVLKELIEAYSEVELAADALTKKRIELAVPREQAGLELAEGLTENIEKWLPDVRDAIKWNMEEFDGELPDVPMAELPDQLEDLIGELIEDEEDLGDDMEDVTSGWADSIDKGAGWGTSDGPISNMSAQGKTGNTLPNKNEVGGRSGEGRTGRSHGEMVEAEASGKGGRKTPTRLTPDAYEGKAVKDRSKDPLGGATGGGKLSGGAGGGLRGPLPPQVKGDLGRLAGNQVSIRQKAEQLDRALKQLHYPDEELERSIVMMKSLEDALAKGDLAGFARKHALLVDQMKESRKTLIDHARVVKDRSKSVPKELMREMESVDLSTLPEGYRKMLREYYKILSRGGSE